MRAVLYDRFGHADVLRVGEIAEPQPAAGEFAIRVRAASLNPIDVKIRSGELRWLPVLGRPPRGSGSDFAGEIVGVGGGATTHHVGERVVGALMPLHRQGAFAETVVATDARFATLPDGLDFAPAAALPIAAGTALQALVDQAHVAPKSRVLITGAAGGVGHFAVQLAKHAGAHVTAVCSAANLDFVRSLGADAAIDYRVVDFTRGDARYDIVFDAAGASTFFACRAVLAPAGIYLNTLGTPAAAVMTAAGSVATFASRQRVVGVALRAGAAIWARLAQLARDGVLKPHISRTVGFEGVAAAQRDMESGHARGKVIVVP